MLIKTLDYISSPEEDGKLVNIVQIKQYTIAELCLCRDSLVLQLILHGLSACAALSAYKKE